MVPPFSLVKNHADCWCVGEEVAHGLDP
jgi:hypothetical protein